MPAHTSVIGPIYLCTITILPKLLVQIHTFLSIEVGEAFIATIVNVGTYIYNDVLNRCVHTLIRTMAHIHECQPQEPS